MVRVAINGYGRIGRVAHRIIVENFASDIEVVALNAGSSTDLKGWMYLLQYDSVYGIFPYSLSVIPNQDTAKPDFLGTLVVNGKELPVYSQKDPSLLPWKDNNVDVVLECTGKLLTAEKAQGHLTAGAKAVIMSAPAKDPSTSSGQVIPTYVLGINDKQYSGETIISNASCTTNCISPVAKVIHDTFGIEKAMMTTVHGYTSDQRLHDGGHKDYRRSRAAGLNIIPTTTGATKAAAKAMPELKDIFTGLALRVPVPVGSLSDFTFLLKRETSKEEVNDSLRKAALSPDYEGILAVTEDPIVSSDIIGSPYSSIVDLSLTQVVGGNMVKVIAWYDNEYGYATRLVEEVVMVGKKLLDK
ncbi:MAG: type I glyceraldehyde-3-phosphate dehydrogenase [Candidatus Levybacteria bacterium]|nr:type I glyceraldehyde-3-phosphate dehydrogenase [Candidatus Levybacteria bacterium]